MLESVRMFTFHRIATTTNRMPKNDLIFDADFEHPTCKGKSITMCIGVLSDSSLCQNGKQVEIITKMIFELCYIEVIFCGKIIARGRVIEA